MRPFRHLIPLLAALLPLGLPPFSGPVLASDHLDTPTVIADPRADIGDLYAWMSPDGRQLNLVMTIVGHSLSDRLDYTFHIDSAHRFGKPGNASGRSMDLTCRFPGLQQADCRLGGIDRVQGDASSTEGLWGEHHRVRLYAGLRDDPFFNNVRGTRQAYQVAEAALARGVAKDKAGCPAFDAATSAEILDKWRHTDGGPAKNLLAGWTPMAIVASVDVDAVNQGGPLLAVWAATAGAKGQVDRAGRPLTGNALLGQLRSDEEGDRWKEAYNAATPADGARFEAEIARGLAYYDSFDGQCGNQWLADARASPARRYHRLAATLADDRLWVNSATGICTQMFAVELAALSDERALRSDCGGRTLTYDASNIYRSFLVNGTAAGVADGLTRDEHPPSNTIFPFLVAPKVPPS
ncbi:DUF4331 domain-containing protein [Nitrospirillum bahiense]|uniref:DUF4331 domain-containing protein n=1 Tax=Nitrospirillum amazonense TaxID=28077 RepID=A0A560GCJ9_9PROT|nr:DUF4331 domain-containing protein [Nitrospirillum amazonense]TWB31645.1 hypothetical protein FBZ88_10114 [Nitrospirillum amazonense]